MDEYKKIAAKLVALKSVSADSSCKDDCKKTAAFLKEFLVSYDFDVQTIEGYGNPVVFGSYIVNPKHETCLIYGHYDVQPAEKEDGWNSDPFEMVEKDGKLLGRGIMDDKCQFLIHILTIGKLIEEKKLGYNIKFLFEGEEELGSPHIEQFVKDHTKELACDFIMISDGEKIQGRPTLELGNRGILNCTLTVQTSTQDNHSGIYGGVVPNAIHELSEIIASLHTKEHSIAIEGFYNDVEDIDTQNIVSFDFEEYKKNTGTKTVLQESKYDFYNQVGLRPALIVTGMYGGFIQPGHKTTIPPKATAKLNFRLVKNQDPHKIAKVVEKHFAKIIPDYIAYTLTFEEFASPNKTETNNSFVQKAKKILEALFKGKIAYRYVGATEPVVAYFQQILGKPIVSIPFSDEDAHMHGINENFKIKDIETGMRFSERFFES